MVQSQSNMFGTARAAVSAGKVLATNAEFTNKVTVKELDVVGGALIENLTAEDLNAGQLKAVTLGVAELTANKLDVAELTANKLGVEGDETVKGDFDVGGNGTVKGNYTVDGYGTVKGDFDVGGNGTVKGKLFTSDTETKGKTITKDLEVLVHAAIPNISGNNATLETFAAKSATVDDIHADRAMFAGAEVSDMKVSNNLDVDETTTTKTTVFTDVSGTIPAPLRTVEAGNIKRLYNQFNVKNEITTKLTYSTGKARATLFDASSYEMIKRNGERPVIFYENDSSCTLVNIGGELYALMAYHTFLIDDVNSKIQYIKEGERDEYGELIPGTEVFENSILNPLYNLYVNWFGYTPEVTRQRLILDRMRALANNTTIPVMSYHNDKYNEEEKIGAFDDFTYYNYYFNEYMGSGAWPYIAERDYAGNKVVEINILDQINDDYRKHFNDQNVQLTLNRGDKLFRIELNNLFNEDTNNLFLPDSDLAALHITADHFHNRADYNFFIQNALKIDSDNLEDHNPTIEDINSLAINNNIAISAFTDDGFALTNPLNVVIQGEGRYAEIINEYSDNYYGTGYNRGIQCYTVNETLGKESSGSPLVYFNDNTLETILMGTKTHETDNIGSYSSIFYILNGFKLVEFESAFQRNRHVLNHMMVNGNNFRTDYLLWQIYTYRTNAAPTTIDEFSNTEYNVSNNNIQNYNLQKIYPEGLSSNLGLNEEGEPIPYYEIGDKVIEEITETKITQNRVWHADIFLTKDVTPWGDTPGQYEADAIINGEQDKVYFQNWHIITGPHPLAIHVSRNILRRVILHMINNRTTSNYEKMVNRKKLKDAESKLEKRLRDDKLI